MAKALTWGECRDHTLRTLDTWRNGGGRESAILYSNYFSEYQGDGFPVHRITKPLMTELCVQLEEDKGIKNSTINRFISAVSVVLKHCKEEDMIKFDLPTPFKRRNEKKGKQKRKYYTKDQVKEMEHIARNVMCNDNLAELIKFAALTGMRLDEILKLPAWRVDFNLRLINVEDTKGYDPRTIPIHASLMPTLIKRCKESSEKGEPDVKVFGNDWGKHDNRKAKADAVRHQFEKILFRYMKLRDDGSYVFHCLRHTFATWHLAQGTPPLELMAMLGHKNLSTTLEYAHATSEGQRAAQDKLEY